MTDASGELTSELVPQPVQSRDPPQERASIALKLAVTLWRDA